MNEKLDGEIVPLWEVYGESDTDEGRGGTYLVGYYLTIDEAREAALTKGVFGMPSSHITMCNGLLARSKDGCKDQYYLLKNITISNIEVKLRERALAKLSEDEKRVLGLI